MLWGKRLDRENGGMVYVDVLNNKKFDMKKCLNEMILEFAESAALFNSSPKDDEISTMFRHEGNDLYLRKHNLESAILKYNQAILTAELETENMGMCYANRAACFMDLKKYSLCLRDIALAKKNNYPQRLWPKLEERKLKCLKLMKIDKEPQRDATKLSFSSDKKFPCFVHGLEMKQSKNGDKHIVTNRALGIGQTVIIEEAYDLVSESPINYSHCSNCFKTDVNLIPCRKCSFVMFCSQDCYDAGHERFHNIECTIQYRFINWETVRCLVFRTIIVAIQTFGTIEALMDAVELFHKQNKIDESDVAKRNYFKFFGPPQDTEKIPYERDLKFRCYTLIMQTIIEHESILKPMFRTVRNQRFLGHLILHHIYVINKNSFYAINFVPSTYKAQLGMYNDTFGSIYGRGVTVDSLNMNNSCVPNVARIFVDNKIVYKVIRPIESGQELFITYIHPIGLLGTTQYRAQKLLEGYLVECNCPSCKSNVPPFKSDGRVKIDESLRELMNSFQGLPHFAIPYLLSVNRSELEKFEKLIIEHLMGMDRLHPNKVTLLLQFLLIQIWNNQYSVNAA